MFSVAGLFTFSKCGLRRSMAKFRGRGQSLSVRLDISSRGSSPCRNRQGGNSPLSSNCFQVTLDSNRNISANIGHGVPRVKGIRQKSGARCKGKGKLSVAVWKIALNQQPVTVGASDAFSALNQSSNFKIDLMSGCRQMRCLSKESMWGQFTNQSLQHSE